MRSQMDPFNHGILSVMSVMPKKGCHTLKRKGAPKIRKCSWLKETTKVRGSANKQEVLLVNYKLGMEMGILVPDLLYKHMAMGFR